MISRFSRYPGGKILGFGATTHMQKRNFMSDRDVLMCFGIIATVPALTACLGYQSLKYLYNNYKIIRKK